MFCAAPRPVLDVPSVLYLPKTGRIAHRIGLHEVYMVVLKYVWPPPHDVIRFKPSWLKPFKLNVGSCLAWSVAVRQTLFHGRSPSAALSPSLSTQVNSDWMKLNHEKWSYDPSQGFCLLCRWVVKNVTHIYRLVQKKRDCFVKHQPGVAGCGWLQPGRNFLST